MKNVSISLSDFLEERNPLSFKDAKGKIMYFRDYESAYYEFFQRIFEAGPKYVDMVLFCMDTYGMTKSDAERFVSRWRCFGITEDAILTNWWFGDNQLERKRLIDCLQGVAQGLHMLAGTKFKKDMFLGAFSRFESNLIALTINVK